MSVEDKIPDHSAFSRARHERFRASDAWPRAWKWIEPLFGDCDPKLAGPAQVFRNRSGHAYTKDTLGNDFRAVRAVLFFRRTGAALAGQVDPTQLSRKMANSFSTSNRLHKTYGPVQLAAVRNADAARQRGRAKLREQNSAESVTASDRKASQRRSINPKSLK